MCFDFYLFDWLWKQSFNFHLLAIVDHHIWSGESCFKVGDTKTLVSERGHTKFQYKIKKDDFKPQIMQIWFWKWSDTSDYSMIVLL